MRLVFGPCDVFLSSGAPHRSHIPYYPALTSCGTHVSSIQWHVVQRLKDARQARSWDHAFYSTNGVSNWRCAMQIKCTSELRKGPTG